MSSQSEQAASCHKPSVCQDNFYPLHQLSTGRVALGGSRGDCTARVGDFSDRIKWLRVSAAMDQKDFADALGLNRKTIGLWENEDVSLQRNTLALLASFFDVPIDEITDFLSGTAPLRTIPRPMRTWIQVDRVSNATTVGELSKLAGGKHE